MAISAKAHKEEFQSHQPKSLLSSCICLNKPKSLHQEGKSALHHLSTPGHRNAKVQNGLRYHALKGKCEPEFCFLTEGDVYSKHRLTLRYMMLLEIVDLSEQVLLC